MFCPENLELYNWLIWELLRHVHIRYCLDNAFMDYDHATCLYHDHSAACVVSARAHFKDV